MKVNKIFEEIGKLIDEGKYKEAEKRYLELLKKEPGHKGLKEGLGKLYLSMGNEDKAKKYIKVPNLVKKPEFEYEKVEIKYLRLLKETPGNKGLREKLGKLYLSVGEKDKAKKYISNNLIKETEEKSERFFDEINKLINKKAFKEAESKYLELLQEKPGHKGLIEGLGKLYIEMGKEDKAKKYIKIEDLKEAFGFRKEFKRVSILVDKGKRKEAEKVYLKLLRKRPGHKGLKEGLGELYIEMGEEDKAKKYINNDLLKEIKIKLEMFEKNK